MFYNVCLRIWARFGWPDEGNGLFLYRIIRLAIAYSPMKPMLLQSIFQSLTMVKPVIYGNVAKYFGKKREEDGHTHQWTVYVRPFDNEDMSVYVKKINFKLHDSYANQNRVLTKPPYEVTETGWGEFEIIIKIYFHDPNERPVRFV